MEGKDAVQLSGLNRLLCPALDGIAATGLWKGLFDFRHAVLKLYNASCQTS